MRIRDAITKPVLLAGIGALALGTAVAITVVGTTDVPAPHYDCVQPKPPPAPVHHNTAAPA